jgi:hypothetical protein
MRHLSIELENQRPQQGVKGIGHAREPAHAVTLLSNPIKQQNRRSKPRQSTHFAGASKKDSTFPASICLNWWTGCPNPAMAIQANFHNSLIIKDL